MMNGAAVRNSTHVLLGVCTYQRPQMLLRCLLSIRRLQEPEGVRLTVVVVDNEPVPTAHELVQSLAGNSAIAASPMPMLYVHEPRRGIAQARNAILAKADEIGAGWVAMIDDDQTIPADWLLNMWDVSRSFKADVTWNCIDLDWPDPLPKWAFPKRRKHRWMVGCEMADTGGVLFRADLKDRSGEPLRFGTEFALTGGEDGDFFLRATQAGALIVRTPQAISIEHLVPSKCSFSVQVERAYWIAIANTRRRIRFGGYVPALVQKSVPFTNALFGGIGNFIVAPFIAPFSRPRARKHLLKGSKKIAKAAGISSGLLGVARPEPYRTIHGN